MNEEPTRTRFEAKPLLITTGIYICVLLIGAAAFVAIERQDDSDQAKRIQSARDTVKNITQTYKMTDADARRLENAILQEKEELDSAGKPKWSYSNAVFFTFTIMTTIGKNFEKNSGIQNGGTELFGIAPRRARFVEIG